MPNFCKSLYKGEPEPSFLRIHRFKIAERPVCLVAFNSCRIESRQNAGLGFVGREQIHVALRFLRDLDADPAELRLALMHHHLMPVNYFEGIPWDTKKTSITLDAEAVLRCLISAKFCAVFHGHQHQPYISEVRRVIQDYTDPYFPPDGGLLDGKVAVVGGGSAGVARGDLNLVGRNAYNIVELGQMGQIKVRTRVHSSVGSGFSDYQLTSLEE